MWSNFTTKEFILVDNFALLYVHKEDPFEKNIIELFKSFKEEHSVFYPKLPLGIEHMRFKSFCHKVIVD